MKKLNLGTVLILVSLMVSVGGMTIDANASSKKSKKVAVEEAEGGDSRGELTESEGDEEEEVVEKPIRKKKRTRSAYQRRYGMAGCGVGSLIFTKDTQGHQLATWFTHWVAGSYFTPLNPTWAISSGTSNCTDRPQEVAMEQEVFLNVNLASLTKEAAAGAGEHLEAFAEVLGCQSKVEFGKFSQQNFESLFENQKPNEVLNRYLEKLRAHPEFSKECRRVG